MSTHEDAKDPKDLNGSESMKPDPEFQVFFDKLVGTGARSARLFNSASEVTVAAVDNLCKAVLPKYEEPTNPAGSDALSITDTSRPGPYHKIHAIAAAVGSIPDGGDAHCTWAKLKKKRSRGALLGMLLAHCSPIVAEDIDAFKSRKSVTDALRARDTKPTAANIKTTMAAVSAGLNEWLSSTCATWFDALPADTDDGESTNDQPAGDGESANDQPASAGASIQRSGAVDGADTGASNQRTGAADGDGDGKRRSVSFDDEHNASKHARRSDPSWPGALDSPQGRFIADTLEPLGKDWISPRNLAAFCCHVNPGVRMDETDAGEHIVQATFLCMGAVKGAALSKAISQSRSDCADGDALAAHISAEDFLECIWIDPRSPAADILGPFGKNAVSVRALARALNVAPAPASSIASRVAGEIEAWPLTSGLAAAEARKTARDEAAFVNAVVGTARGAAASSGPTQADIRTAAAICGRAGLAETDAHALAEAFPVNSIASLSSPAPIYEALRVAGFNHTSAAAIWAAAKEIKAANDCTAAGSPRALPNLPGIALHASPDLEAARDSTTAPGIDGIKNFVNFARGAACAGTWLIASSAIPAAAAGMARWRELFTDILARANEWLHDAAAMRLVTVADEIKPDSFANFRARDVTAFFDAPEIKKINEALGFSNPTHKGMVFDPWASTPHKVATVAAFWDPLFQAWHGFSTLEVATGANSLFEAGVLPQFGLNILMTATRRWRDSARAARTRGFGSNSPRTATIIWPPAGLSPTDSAEIAKECSGAWKMKAYADAASTPTKKRGPPGQDAGGDDADARRERQKQRNIDKREAAPLKINFVKTPEGGKPTTRAQLRKAVNSWNASNAICFFKEFTGHAAASQGDRLTSDKATAEGISPATVPNGGKEDEPVTAATASPPATITPAAPPERHEDGTITFADAISRNWQQAAIEAVRNNPFTPIWALSVASATALSAVDQLGCAVGSETEPPPAAQAPPLVCCEPEAHARFPSVCAPPITEPRQPRDNEIEECATFCANARKERGGSIKLTDIAMPEALKAIALWLESAKRYAQQMRENSERRGKKKRSARKPPDLVLREEDTLFAWARGRRWNTMDPDNCFPIPVDKPFKEDASVKLNCDWLAAEAERIGFSDKELISDLTSGMRFNETSELSRTTILSANAAALEPHCAAAEDEVLEQCDKGWSTRHVDKEDQPVWNFVPFLPIRILPQSSAAKKHTTKRRRTTNGSKDAPGARGEAINDAIDAKLLPRTKLPTCAIFAQILAILAAAGQTVFAALVDISAAYNQLVHASEYHWATCALYSFGIVVERRLGFGLSPSSNNFQRTTALITAIATDHYRTAEERDPITEDEATEAFFKARAAAFKDEPGQADKAHTGGYIDDFFAAGAGWKSTMRMAIILVATLTRAGFPLSPKTQGLATFVIFLGLAFDTKAGVCTAPEDKIARLYTDMNALLEGVLGSPASFIDQRRLLSWAHAVNWLVPAAPLIRGRLNLVFRAAHAPVSKSAPPGSGAVRASKSLTEAMRASMRAAASSVGQSLGCVASMPTINGLATHLKGVSFADISSDASGGPNGKIAIYCKGAYAVWAPPLDILRFCNIATLEAIGVLATTVAFAAEVAGHQVRLACDNAAVCWVVNSLKAHNVELAMALNAILDAAEQAGCVLGLVHIRSALNIPADAASRDDFIRMRDYGIKAGHYSPTSTDDDIKARQVNFPKVAMDVAAAIAAVTQAAWSETHRAEDPPGVVNPHAPSGDLTPAQYEKAKQGGFLDAPF